ncbi:MAG: recombinase family protein [Rubrobacteraceae bacterium]
MEKAAIYIRTNTGDDLPSREKQRAGIEAHAGASGYEIVAGYEDLEAPGEFLYHKPSLREAINNIKELEEWEVLVSADPRCFSETESALHELAHKFSLYGNRLECPNKSWEEFESEMKSYRREMSGR